MARLGKRHTISQIKKHQNKTVRTIATVYESQIFGTFGSDESFAIEKVNQLRESLLFSGDMLSFKKIGGLKDEENPENDINLTVGEICQTAATPEKWGTFQFRLIRKLKPHNCLEMGTNLGISGSYILSAQALNDSGFFVTLEGNEQLAEIAAANFKKLQFVKYEIITGLFQDTLPGVLEKHKTFDYVFIDGHHDKEATIKYFQLIRPHLTEDSVVVFDDINWSEGMREAWAVISQEKGIVATFDYYKLGIIVFNASGMEHVSRFNLVL